MKTLLFSIAFACITYSGFAATPADSVHLTVDGNIAYYQRVVKADSIPEGLIFSRALLFFAAKNFQQNYGSESEGKLIFNTTQDLNVNPVYIGDENDDIQPYTVQFAITVDMKNNRYRYKISNIVIFRPTETGNKRLTMYDEYQKANSQESRRVQRDAQKLITSFETYIGSLTAELYKAIKPQSMVYDTNF